MIKLKNIILDLIFPTECVGCGCEGKWLCKKCFRKLEINNFQTCFECQKYNQFGEFCHKCAKKYNLNGIWTAGNYENKILSKLIKDLKYKFIKTMADDLCKFLSIYINNLINISRINQTEKTPKILLNFKNSLTIPVPLHKKRFHWRGFNQTEIIAKIISSNFNLSNSYKLKRIINKKPQAKLNEQNRKNNIKNCYAWTGNNLKNKNIILLDDVVTTGSTLNECARILKNAGANEVWGLAIAKG